MPQAVIVKIVQLGTKVQSYAIEPGSTVEDLFIQAEREFVQGEVTRNQACVSENTILYDGDTLYVAKVVKGNADPFEVEIFRLGGGHAITLPAQDGMSINAILNQLNSDEKVQFFRANGTPAFEFRINGELVTIEHVPNRPSSGKIRIICAQVVKGNLFEEIINAIAIRYYTIKRFPVIIINLR